MRCQEFETRVVDLVRGEVRDSELATRCWAHAATCSVCAELLLAQEKLTAGLETLAASAEQNLALERIESVLRTAFQAQLARPQGRLAPRMFAAKASRPVGIASSRLAWAMGAAAALLILGIVMAARWRWAPTSPPVAQVRVTPDQSGGAAEPAPRARKHETSAPAASVVRHSHTQATKKAPAARTPAGGKSNSKARPANPVRRNPNDEFAGDFIQLPYGSGLPLDEGWEMVRVSLPRSALESLGVMPVDEQAPGEKITAELLLGEDGLARGIRFVQ